MAKPGERVAGSHRDRVMTYLIEHPGSHRCTEFAAGTGLSTHQAALACYQVFQDRPGEILRGTRPANNGGRAFKTYAASAEAIAAAAVTPERQDQDLMNAPPSTT